MHDTTDILQILNELKSDLYFSCLDKDGYCGGDCSKCDYHGVSEKVFNSAYNNIVNKYCK